MNAGDDVEVAGTWSLTIQTPIGTHEVVLSIEVVDGRLTGAARGAAEEVPMEDLTVDRRHLRWRQQIHRPMRLNLVFDVVVDGNVLHGTSRAGRLPASAVTGHRTATR